MQIEERDITLAKDVDPYDGDPDLSELMRKKARQTNPLRLVEEIELLHHGLHEATSANLILLAEMKMLRRFISEKMTIDGANHVSILLTALSRLEGMEDKAKGVA